MRLRFTIRDLLWLTLVALSVGWIVDSIRHEEMAREGAAYKANIEQMQREVNYAKHNADGLELIVDRLDRERKFVNQLPDRPAN